MPPPTAPIDPALLDPRPLIQSGRNWTRWAGPLVSVLILVVALHQFRGLDPASLWALVPGGIAFWAAFALYYLAGPLSEWVIFRRLWSIPPDGFAALLRKLVSNEILLGYLGEVYFYAWARRHAKITTAPFGAIKDVTILSALVGNGVTLVMVAFAVPLLGAVDARLNTWEVGGSILFVLATSLVAMLLRKRLFTLPRKALWMVAAIHLLRIVATTVLAAMMWHMLLPDIALSWWILLGTLRQLVSRLPFLPNKDVVFAGMAAFLIGRDSEIVSAMALMASLILAAHLLVGITLGATGLLRESRAQ
ncbi:hypothetical protein HHL26_02710 [Sphingobium sp. TB-6]|nr:hypothetical protein [Sphingobium sp. TB-6]